MFLFFIVSQKLHIFHFYNFSIFLHFGKIVRSGMSYQIVHLQASECFSANALLTRSPKLFQGCILLFLFLFVFVFVSYSFLYSFSYSFNRNNSKNSTNYSTSRRRLRRRRVSVCGRGVAPKSYLTVLTRYCSVLRNRNWNKEQTEIETKITAGN